MKYRYMYNKISQHLLFLINIMIKLQLKLPSKIRDWPPCQPSLPPFKPRIDCCCLVSSPTKAQAPALSLAQHYDVLACMRMHVNRRILRRLALLNAWLLRLAFCSLPHPIPPRPVIITYPHRHIYPRVPHLCLQMQSIFIPKDLRDQSFPPPLSRIRITYI